MPEKINILFINYSYDIGGIETLILGMCKALDKDRYNVCVCSFKETNALADEFKKAKIPIYVLKKSHGINFILIYRLRKLFKMLHIDIIHTHNSTQWLYGVMACLGLSKPRIIHTQHTELSKDKKLLLFSLKYLLKKTSQFVSIGQYVSNFFFTYAGIQREQIKLIYNGINFDEFNDKCAAGQNTSIQGIMEKDLIVGMVARMFPVKGYGVLLEAFKTVTQKISSVKLVLVGDGPLKNELHAYASALGLKERVIFLGARRDVPQLLKRFDVFVLSSFCEGISVALLEAMAAGLPIVATDVGGNREIVSENETGLIVPAGDVDKLAYALCTLLGDNDRCFLFSMNAQKKVQEKFSFYRMMQDYCAIYESANRIGSIAQPLKGEKLEY